MLPRQRYDSVSAVVELLPAEPPVSVAASPAAVRQRAVLLVTLLPGTLPPQELSDSDTAQGSADSVPCATK